MIYSKKATSILEAMVVMLVVVTWVTGMYKIYIQSIKLSDSTANKIQAIQIAREWIEAMTNIRDTNWLLFSSDYSNCWNTLNYNNSCIWNNSTATDMLWNYIIYKNSDNRWELKIAASWNYSDIDYHTENRVWYDNNGFYTQSGATLELKPVFTREIQIEYIDTDGDSFATSNDEKMKVTSLVQWTDSSSTKPHKVELGTILSNWKEKK